MVREVLHHRPCFEEAALRVLHPPQHWLAVRYDVEGSLHQRVSSRQVTGSLGGGAGDAVLGAGRRSPDDVVVRQTLQVKLSNIHAPGGISQNIHGVDVPAKVGKGAPNRARAAEELQQARRFIYGRIWGKRVQRVRKLVPPSGNPKHDSHGSVQQLLPSPLRVRPLLPSACGAARLAQPDYGDIAAAAGEPLRALQCRPVQKPVP